MKKMVLLTALTASAALAAALPASAFAKGGSYSYRPATGTGSKMSHSHVSGYTKKSGIYVAPHDRSTRDHSTTNNWSTKGNQNPETGRNGTK